MPVCGNLSTARHIDVTPVDRVEGIRATLHPLNFCCQCSFAAASASRPALFTIRWRISLISFLASLAAALGGRIDAAMFVDCGASVVIVIVVAVTGSW